MLLGHERRRILQRYKPRYHNRSGRRQILRHLRVLMGYGKDRARPDARTLRLEDDCLHSDARRHWIHRLAFHRQPLVWRRQRDRQHTAQQRQTRHRHWLSYSRRRRIPAAPPLPSHHSTGHR